MPQNAVPAFFVPSSSADGLVDAVTIPVNAVTVSVDADFESRGFPLYLAPNCFRIAFIYP